jgi:excinuclease ABC subunit C
MKEPAKISERERGAAVVRFLAATLPDAPGVYRMLDKKGEPLYVGKARSLRRRVVTYANVGKLPVRLQRMIALTFDMIFVRTHTEAEALLLESNLIKKFQPRYNILLRDDKSFPYIFISGDHDFPVLAKHRGARSRKGDYFGPFAAAGAVNRTVLILQKAFMLRNCTDSYFAQRKRPCLQYHIRRCTAPCVGLVGKDDYAKQVKEARDFLAGKTKEVQERLAALMQTASDKHDFEAAAILRDRIRALTAIQSRQDVNVKGLGDADVFGMHRDGARACVQVFFFRAGQNFGNRAYFPRHAEDVPDHSILSAFIAQFYDNKPVPGEIIVSHDLAEKNLLEQAFMTRDGGKRKIEVICPQRGMRKRLADFVVKNAKQALAQDNLRQAGEKELLEKVGALCGLEDAPARIEVYDNSHISGTDMVGAMVVAGQEGLRKNAYRKFNIKTADAADDYGMMREVMQRRFSRALKEEKGPGHPDWPDLLLIDGGLGQLNSVHEVLKEMGVDDGVAVLSIAKGPDRNAGREKFFMAGRAVFQLPPDDPVLHYLQRLRDEAHRFAVGAHRTRRAMQISSSPLDDVPGIGASRKKALLHHFGSGQQVARAGLKDLEQVKGISKAVAGRIYAHFHEE